MQQHGRIDETKFEFTVSIIFILFLTNLFFTVGFQQVMVIK